MNSSIKKLSAILLIAPAYINCMSHNLEVEQKRLFDSLRNIKTALDITTKAIKEGADINMIFNENPIHWHQDDPTVLNNGDTLIDYAARNGNVNFTKLLLSFGANPNKLGNSSPFRKALLNNHMETVEILLDNPQFNQETLNRSLISIISHNKAFELDEKLILEKILFLIIKGANVNYQNEEGNTALMWAANNNKLDVIKILIEHYADLDLLDKSERSAFIFATSIEAAKILLSAQSQEKLNQTLVSTITHSNSSKRDARCTLEKISLLILKGANVNYQDEDGVTPLMYAILVNNLKIAAILIENGASYTLQDNLGRNAYDIAKEFGRKSIPKYMLNQYKKCIKERIEESNTLPTKDIQDIVCNYIL